VINELEYNILKEVKRYNENVKVDILFYEVTSWCQQHKLTSQYLTANKTIRGLIEGGYICADGKNKLEDTNDALTITSKGKTAVKKYERNTGNGSNLWKLWKKLSMGMKVIIVGSGVVITDVIAELIVRTITGEWSLLLELLKQLINM